MRGRPERRIFSRARGGRGVGGRPVFPSRSSGVCFRLQSIFVCNRGWCILLFLLYTPSGTEENRLRTKTDARRTGRKHGLASDPPPAARPGKNTPFGETPHSDLAVSRLSWFAADPRMGPHSPDHVAPGLRPYYSLKRLLNYLVIY